VVDDVLSPLVFHSYFLKSDEWMLSENGGHYSFEQLENDSTNFDNYFWNNAISPVIYIADHAYYINGINWLGSLCSYNTVSGDTKTLYSFKNYWRSSDDGKYAWQRTLSGLVYRGGRLYFNTDKAVLSCLLDGTDLTTEHAANISAVNNLYGISFKNGGFVYCHGARTNNQSDFTQTAFTVNTSKQVDMCISDTFVYGGKKHISYSNLTGSGFSFYVFTKQGGKLTDVEVIHRPAGNGTVEISIDGDVEIMAVNSAFAPIMDKCAA